MKFINSNKNLSLGISFLLGFAICLIGINIEGFWHNSNFNDSIISISHIILPIAIGVLTSFIGFAYWKNQKKKLEHKYRYKLLYENITDVVCILDSEKRIIEINPAGEKLFCYSRDEMINEHVSNFIYKGDKEISDKNFHLLKKKGFYNLYQGRIVTKNGELKWIEINSSELEMNGEIIGSQDIIRDITERKNIEIELEQKVEELNQLNNTKDKLISIISHDLRSPFNTIIGFAQILLEKIQNNDFEETESISNYIITSANRTINLLDNLLNWARTQSSQTTINPRELNFSSLKEELFNELANTALLKNISLDNSSTQNETVYADENMLKIILRNLLTNAIKFTPDSGTVSLSIKREQDKSTITISDNGIGLSDENRKKLFNSEENFTTYGTANEKGTGIGLLLCKRLVDLHCGKIGVKSVVGKGSDFWFTMPHSNQHS